MTWCPDKYDLLLSALLLLLGFYGSMSIEKDEKALHVVIIGYTMGLSKRIFPG